MSNNQRDIKDAIQAVIIDMMERVMNRVLITDPFLIDKFHAEKPLYAALVPDEIFKGSHFERRFVTPFGSAWENLTITAATFGLGHAEKHRRIFGTVRSERLRRITQVLNTLEHPPRDKNRIKPNWDRELDFILSGGGEEIPLEVISDVFVVDTEHNRKYAFELKSPMPNSDISKVSKEKLLKLYSMEPRQVDEAYFALPYNPYGTRDNYNWSFPARWFDMRHDSVVLIGEEFWEKVGGLGTYQAFINAVKEIGEMYKTRIYREYLGIEPPRNDVAHRLE